VANSFPEGNSFDGTAIETRSVSLDPALFPLLADGNVSLLGTHISEGVGGGSFVIDFLSITLDVSAPAVPEPGTLGIVALLAAGLISIGRRARG
jgi:hypothetical protein